MTKKLCLFISIRERKIMIYCNRCLRSISSQWSFWMLIAWKRIRSCVIRHLKWIVIPRFDFIHLEEVRKSNQKWYFRSQWTWMTLRARSRTSFRGLRTHFWVKILTTIEWSKLSKNVNGALPISTVRGKSPLLSKPLHCRQSSWISSITGKWKTLHLNFLKHIIWIEMIYQPLFSIMLCLISTMTSTRRTEAHRI